MAPDFDHYRERSREVMEVLREQVDTVEVVGLDEAYLDLTGFERPNAAGAADQGRRSPSAPASACSIGHRARASWWPRWPPTPTSPTASSSLTAEEARERFGRRSPRLVPGIGPKTAERLEARGITRLDQLAPRWPTPTCRSWFGGRLGPHLGSLARFEDERELETERVRKSESRETTFDRDLRGLDADGAGARAPGRPSSATTWRATSAAAARSGSRCAWTTSPSTPAHGRSASR